MTEQVEEVSKEEQANQLVRDLILEMWREGILVWKLRDHQKNLYAKISSFMESPISKGLKFVANCSRRFGKTFTMCLIAIEFALRNPKCHIRFAAPSAKQLRGIIHPIFEIICSDAPFKLNWKAHDSYYEFPNEAKIHVAGCDDDTAIESLRGHASHLNLITEGGSIKRLDYVLKSILLPQTLDTGGKTIIDSTPPPDPNHYFNSLCDETEMTGNYAEFTIIQNTHLTEEQREEHLKEAGGRDSTTALREYFCKRIVDSERALVAEWNESYIADLPNPQYYGWLHKYESGDIGVSDKTVFLFGYYDFPNGRLYIQDEFAIQGQNVRTDVIDDLIREKRKKLQWNEPYRSVCDIDKLLINDLHHRGLYFNPVKKENNLHSMLNKVKLFIKSDRLIVHPGCKELIGCLKSGVWDKDRRKFDKSQVFGHFDALAALMYMIISLDEFTNPIPSHIGISNLTHMRIPQQTTEYSAFKEAFKK